MLVVVLYAYFEILNRWPIQDLPNQKNLMSTFAKNKSDTTKLGQMYGAGEKAMLSLHDALHHKKDWLEFVKKTINQRHTVLPLILYIKVGLAVTCIYGLTCVLKEFDKGTTAERRPITSGGKDKLL